MHPQSHLAEFTGVLQVDGYAGFNRVGSVELAFCWAHVRRKFFDFHHATGSPIAGERCGGSPNSTKSKRASAAARPMTGPASARPGARHWSTP